MSYEDEDIEEYKIVLIGDSSVGKTAIINRFSDNTFTESLMSTIGVDFRYKDVDIDGTKVRLQIWDTAGQERFRSVSKNFYRGAHGVVVVYAINDIKSFQSIRVWLTEIEKNVGTNVPINSAASTTSSPSVIKYVIGNKADLEDQRVVNERTGMNEAVTYDAKFMETSAKTSKNIDELFNDITRDIKASLAPPTKKLTGPKLGDKPATDHKGCC